MGTERLLAGVPEHLRRAARLLREGRIVAFPTETVYGLGVRCDDGRAVERLRELKQRPVGKEFSLLVSSLEDAERYGELSGSARRLAEAFWPGPLTLVVPDGRGADVGLRCPDSATARELVRLTGVALAAPSANLSGEPPALTADRVLRDFGGRIAAMVDGGEVAIGVASTVVRASAEQVEVLREGALSEEEIRAALED
ncbi:MAG: L-threonylcarbamoyladenylate synthase [Candidatus Brocadiaceae bacterium]|jgi:L-threonylcarbamoyladenylate synthase